MWSKYDQSTITRQYNYSKITLQSQFDNITTRERSYFDHSRIKERSQYNHSKITVWLQCDQSTIKLRSQYDHKTIAVRWNPRKNQTNVSKKWSTTKVKSQVVLLFEPWNWCYKLFCNYTNMYMLVAFGFIWIYFSQFDWWKAGWH